MTRTRPATANKCRFYPVSKSVHEDAPQRPAGTVGGGADGSHQCQEVVIVDKRLTVRLSGEICQANVTALLRVHKAEFPRWLEKARPIKTIERSKYRVKRKTNKPLIKIFVAF